MAATVVDLMFSPFSRRTVDKKIEIMKHGKPRPVINECVTINSKTISISELYDQEMWLTASEELFSIICWPCLLFPLIYTENRSFVGPLADENLSESILQHKKSAFHISALHQYHVFMKDKLLSDNNQIEKKLEQKINHKRHCDIHKPIIDILCFLLTNESIPDGVTSAFNVFDVENCVEVLMFLKSYDTSGIIEETIDIVKTSPEIRKKTMAAIADVVKINLQKEIQLCSCVSIILSEHARNSKLSLVLRYVHNGNICERFIDIIDTMDMEIIKRRILQLISEYEISSKILSFSCDGGLLTADNVSNLLAFLQKLYPSCMYVPCHFQDINFVLEQRLSKLENCGLFFTTVNSMRMFFQNNSRICGILKNCSKKKIPELNDLKLNNVQFLRILKLYRRHFKAFFTHIAENPRKVTNEELAKAIGFQHILEEYQTVFLIETFYLLLNDVAVLSDALNCGSPEKVFDDDILNSVEDSLMKKKTNGFENLWTLVINELIKDCNPESLQSLGKNETDSLFELYSKAIDIIIEEINIRFKCVHKLDFLSILSCEAHSKLLVSDYQVKQIQQIHDDFIDKEKVINEMKILSKNGWIFGGKSVYEIMDILTKMDLKDTFTGVYRLGEIILTLPCKPSSYSKSPSKNDVIDAWIFKSRKTEVKSLSFLGIEKDYLNSLKSQTDFHESVILKLSENNREEFESEKSEVFEIEI